MWSDFSGVSWQEAQHQKESERNGDKHQISLKTEERKSGRGSIPRRGNVGGMGLKANSNGHKISLLSDIECRTIVTRECQQEVQKFTPYGPHGIQFSGKELKSCKGDTFSMEG